MTESWLQLLPPEWCGWHSRVLPGLKTELQMRTQPQSQNQTDERSAAQHVKSWSQGPGSLAYTSPVLASITV